MCVEGREGLKIRSRGRFTIKLMKLRSLICSSSNSMLLIYFLVIFSHRRSHKLYKFLDSNVWICSDQKFHFRHIMFEISIIYLLWTELSFF